MIEFTDAELKRMLDNQKGFSGVETMMICSKIKAELDRKWTEVKAAGVLFAEEEIKQETLEKTGQVFTDAHEDRVMRFIMDGIKKGFTVETIKALKAAGIPDSFFEETEDKSVGVEQYLN